MYIKWKLLKRYVRVALVSTSIPSKGIQKYPHFLLATDTRIISSLLDQWLLSDFAFCLFLAQTALWSDVKITKLMLILGELYLIKPS